MNNTVKLTEIDRLTSGLPHFECVAGCTDCCGPVVMSRLEWKRILDKLGKREGQMKIGDDLLCPMLDKATHRCTVYEIRPAICKLFGVVEHPKLTCPHVKPEQAITDSECSTIINQIARLGQ